MTLPQFTAEKSLYNADRNYRSGSMTTGTGRVTLSQIQQNPFQVPAGSYLASCFTCFIDLNDGSLNCVCQDFNGYLHATKLYSPWSCPSDISNNDGNLFCQF
jgi:hypothetical protein